MLLVVILMTARTNHSLPRTQAKLHPIFEMETFLYLAVNEGSYIEEKMQKVSNCKWWVERVVISDKRDGEAETNSFADALTAAGVVTGRIIRGRRDRCSSRTLNQILIKRNCEMILYFTISYKRRHRPRSTVGSQVSGLKLSLTCLLSRQLRPLPRTRRNFHRKFAYCCFTANFDI